MSTMKSIFIIDDDESIGTSLRRLLVLDGYNVQYFSSARSFLVSVPADTTGCVISDVYMPDIDGFMLQQKMFQLGYRLPFVFISAHAKTGDRNYAMSHGAVGFLLKPFDESSMLELVHGVVFPK